MKVIVSRLTNMSSKNFASLTHIANNLNSPTKKRRNLKRAWEDRPQKEFLRKMPINIAILFNQKLDLPKNNRKHPLLK